MAWVQAPALDPPQPYPHSHLSLVPVLIASPAVVLTLALVSFFAVALAALMVHAPAALMILVDLPVAAPALIEVVVPATARLLL